MSAFAYRDGVLHSEGVSLADVAAALGTPVYVYSLDEVARRYRAYASAFPDALVCYAYKANANLALCAWLHRLGAGADVVSGGELRVAQAAGVPGSMTIFNGNGKSDREIAAALEAEVLTINVDAVEELDRIAAVAARLGRRAPITLRINPAVDPHTHRHISTGVASSQFGIPVADAEAAYDLVAGDPWLEAVGLHSHIGSQITHLEPFREAAGRVVGLARRLLARGVGLRFLNLGGGLGVDYWRNEDASDNGGAEARLTPADLAAVLSPQLAGLDLKLLLEPGRSIVAPAGALLSEVLHIKHSADVLRVILDTGMNALLRPALYEAHHEIWPVRASVVEMTADIVGPNCETSDVVGHARQLPNLASGDLVAILDTGAYGYAQSSNYNSRPRPAEVAMLGDQWWVVRPAESWEGLLVGQVIPETIKAGAPLPA
ncbi:MAG: diaminopimelate decarboxylase [Anaerolineae bacterium]